MLNLFTHFKDKSSWTYNDFESAQTYIKYVESVSGQFERKLISKAIFSHLPENKESYVLDAACGTGWLTKLLAEKYEKVLGCDSSLPLLDYARKNNPENCTFVEASILEKIPILERPYDSAIICLAIHDVKNPPEAYAQVEKILKDNGKLIVVVANPYYSFPVGVWKRGIWGKIFGGKTHLRLQPYNKLARGRRDFNWKKSIPSYFCTLPEIINSALTSGFELEKMEEIITDEKRGLADRKRQLFMFPMILLFVFQKRK